jgi:hypothetical protein
VTYVAYSYVFHDSEGLLSEEPDTWLVTDTNATGLLPPQGCPLKESWGVRICAEVCYRTIKIRYNEPRDFDNGEPKGPWSYLNV